MLFGSIRSSWNYIKVSFSFPFPFRYSNLFAMETGQMIALFFSAHYSHKYTNHHIPIITFSLLYNEIFFISERFAIDLNFCIHSRAHNIHTWIHETEFRYIHIIIFIQKLHIDLFNSNGKWLQSTCCRIYGSMYRIELLFNAHAGVHT